MKFLVTGVMLLLTSQLWAANARQTVEQVTTTVELQNDVDYIVTSGLSVKVGEATLMYGAFIQAIIDFLIVALVIFFIVKAVNKVKDAAVKKEEEKPEEPAGPTTEELLADILAELKNK